MEQAPTASTDDHILLDDHILSVASASVSTHVSEPFPDALDAHVLVEALLSACSQLYEEEEGEQASKCVKLDCTAGSPSK